LFVSNSKCRRVSISRSVEVMSSIACSSFMARSSRIAASLGDVK
jgi:hypothetical protein